MLIEYVKGNCDNCRDIMMEEGGNKFREMHPELIISKIAYKPLKSESLWDEQAKQDWDILVTKPLRESWHGETDCVQLSTDYELVTLCKKCLISISEKL
jgi:hypothetical protein